jgi:hypothetical protein
LLNAIDYLKWSTRQRRAGTPPQQTPLCAVYVRLAIDLTTRTRAVRVTNIRAIWARAGQLARPDDVFTPMC